MQTQQSFESKWAHRVGLVCSCPHYFIFAVFCPISIWTIFFNIWTVFFSINSNLLLLFYFLRNLHLAVYDTVYGLVGEQKYAYLFLSKKRLKKKKKKSAYVQWEIGKPGRSFHHTDTLLRLFFFFGTPPYCALHRVCLDWTYCCWKLKTENWKHCNKIIFKCVNSIVRPIFNIF